MTLHTESIDLVCCWSGALEARGDAPGLSSYAGKSSLFHSANWARSLSIDEAAAVQTGKRGADSKPRIPMTPAREKAIVAMLRAGHGYNYVARAMDCTRTVPRRLARLHAIPRAVAGSNQYALVMAQ